MLIQYNLLRNIALHAHVAGDKCTLCTTIGSFVYKQSKDETADAIKIAMTKMNQHITMR